MFRFGDQLCFLYFIISVILNELLFVMTISAGEIIDSSLNVTDVPEMLELRQTRMVLSFCILYLMKIETKIINAEKFKCTTSYGGESTMKMEPPNVKHQHFHLPHSAMTAQNEQISSVTSSPKTRTTTLYPATSSATNPLTLTTVDPSIIQRKHHSQSKNGQSQSLRTQQIAPKAIKSSPAATNSTLRSHKTDAPMLNYIFDSHLATNKHHHHDRYGPHFDDLHSGDNLINVTAQAGSIAYLNCRVSLLQDKTVSWVKREPTDDKLELLTVGMQTYSGDVRYSVEFQYPNNWRLKIADVNKSDDGLYECQVSSYPRPLALLIHLTIVVPEVIIADEHGTLLVDKYYEVDSTIQLVCIVRHIAMTSSVVYWLHGEKMLNFDTTRGGISVRSDLMDDGANSTLSIAKVGRSDSGNYSCSIGPNDFYTITVHILNGESLAELYHGSTGVIVENIVVRLWLLLMVVILLS